MYRYKAFGMIVESEYEIPQMLEVSKNTPVDVRIIHADLSAMKFPKNHLIFEKNHLGLEIPELAVFRITNGNLVEVDPEEGCLPSRLAVYLLGSCMGAIMHQRNIFLIHGSCVTDGKRSILLSGDSGAGKSTTAGRFLSKGYKLLTDDVTRIEDIDGRPVVQSSYPSQKLWPDSLEKLNKTDANVHSLYKEDGREKYGISVEESYYDGKAPLSLFVKLVPDEFTELVPMDGIIKVDQLMRNTYRSYMIGKEDKQNHFRQCVMLSQKIPMCVVFRKKDSDTTEEIYQLISEYLEKVEKESR